ncbi:site-specific DNA-methyltransferase [Xanthomonas axonopodis pv. begoniae]|nr:site-specific DNA-methyltransferase [Xanthomonas axonopodis pv. begoniae]PPT33760.1 site-specific DNA-methyltransferase [Xanthomonas axonopodis pv. begoniae]
MPLLNWSDRDADLTRSALTPYRLLEPVASLSYGEVDAPNMLIEGDNLDALKALLPYYGGLVKCVYADPPFNTGQALSDYDDNLEHSIWLSMMYPALDLIRQLMAEDATLFVHIDDNELGYLIAILDEIMGRKNRVAVVSFKQGAPTGHKAINPGMVSTTNFIVVYAKNKAKWKPNRVFTGRERDKRYGKFLVNPHEHFSKWKFVTLAVAVSELSGKKPSELKKEHGDGLESFLNDFVIENASRVAQFVRPDYNAVSKEAQGVIDESLKRPDEILHLARADHADMYFISGQRIIFYSGKLKEVDGVLVAGEPLTTLWDDLLSNNLHKEGGVEFPKSKKPEALIKRCLELATNEGDLVLDSYLGSGTTAAAAHKMKRHWIGIERGEHAETKCQPRLRSVVDGEQSGISKSVGWIGGSGFRFYKLGVPVFDEGGHIREGIKFEHLAAHVWFAETGIARSTRASKKPFLGEHRGVGYYLLFNGILGDESKTGGNVLTKRVLKGLQPFDGPKVIYGESCDLPKERLEEIQITFKQTPYDIKAR